MFARTRMTIVARHLKPCSSGNAGPLEARTSPPFLPELTSVVMNTFLQVTHTQPVLRAQATSLVTSEATLPCASYDHRHPSGTDSAHQVRPRNMRACRPVCHHLGVAAPSRTSAAKPCRHNPPRAHEPRPPHPHACEPRTPATDVAS